MEDNQILIWLLGIIALCMICATIVIVLLALRVLKITKRLDNLLLTSQNDIALLTTQVKQTLSEVKSETTSLFHKASGGVSKLAVATFVAGGIYKILENKKNKKEIQ
jgi:hypothetical protein